MVKIKLKKDSKSSSKKGNNSGIDPAVEEQMKGLIQLLEVAGIDSVDNAEINRASHALKAQGASAVMVFPPEMPDSSVLNDAQIEGMIQKLQQAESPTPRLISAFEQYIESRTVNVQKKSSQELQKEKLRQIQEKRRKQKELQEQNPALYNKQVQQQKSRHTGGANKPIPTLRQPRDAETHQQMTMVQQMQHQQQMMQQPHHSQQQQQQKQQKQQQQQQQQQQQGYDDEDPFGVAPGAGHMEEPEDYQQNDHDDYDEDEEEDEFDEDAEYPMVGPGISDDISVVSDMTTPTVVSCLHVPEEEHYRDMLPPMMMFPPGGGPPLMMQAPKRKNLVSQVSRQTAAAGAGPGAAMMGPGGAAARRRQDYQQAMSKITNPPRPGENINQSDHSGGKKKGVSRAGSGGGGGTKGPARNRSFEEPGQTKMKKKPTKPTSSSVSVDRSEQRMHASSGQLSRGSGNSGDRKKVAKKKPPPPNKRP